MRILYIDQHAAQPSMGGDCRAVQLAQAWQKSGDEVTIVTAGNSRRPDRGSDRQIDMEERQTEGIRFCLLSVPTDDRGLGEYRKNVQAFLRRLYANAAKLAERYRPELVIAADGYPYDFFCARRIAKLAQGKTVFELRTPWAEQRREQYPAEDSRLDRRIAEYAMSSALRSADAVVSFLQRGKEYCRERGIKPARLITLPVPAPPQAVPEALREEDQAALLALREKYPVIAVYAGRLSARRLPELLAGAAGGLQEQGVAAVIAGNGGYKQILRRMVRENGWENVLLLDTQSEQRQLVLYQSADLLYYGDDRRCNAEYGSYEPFLLRLMQSGKPILTVTHGANNAAVEANCALPAGEVSQRGVEKELLRFISMTEQDRAALGRHAADAVRTTHAVAQVAQDYRSTLLRLWV